MRSTLNAYEHMGMAGHWRSTLFQLESRGRLTVLCLGSATSMLSNHYIPEMVAISHSGLFSTRFRAQSGNPHRSFFIGPSASSSIKDLRDRFGSQGPKRDD
jgi:hypothetical protein